MFEPLYKFLESDLPDEKTVEFIEHLLNSIKELAIYNKLPEQIKDELDSDKLNIREFIRFLLFSEGLGLGNLPKGLIPFHRYDKFIVNPFQEHILQGVTISGEKSHFHFTINERFESQIENSIQILKAITGIDFHHSYSVQDPASDSLAFDSDLNTVNDENGKPISRPAGHGTLLANLQKLNYDLVFIRNIDNIQHRNQSQHSVTTRKVLGGALIRLKKLIHATLTDLKSGKSALENLTQLNKEFDLRIPTEQFSDRDFLLNFLNRPVRVCGMVRNEGQPGGGPFWVEDKNGTANRQIVEKSQIANNPSQLSVVLKSTHFNPVEMVCSFRKADGTLFDLNNFRNDDLYFIVHKTHQGKPIQYIEQPGLWNGSMDRWITIFYEIEPQCFSPVKNILDLLKPLHLE